MRNGSGWGEREAAEAASDARPLARCHGSPRGQAGSGQDCMGPSLGQVHLRNLDRVRLLEEPGCLVIDISHQDHDFLRHLRRANETGIGE